MNKPVILLPDHRITYYLNCRNENGDSIRYETIIEFEVGRSFVDIGRERFANVQPPEGYTGVAVGRCWDREGQTEVGPIFGPFSD